MKITLTEIIQKQTAAREASLEKERSDMQALADRVGGTLAKYAGPKSRSPYRPKARRGR